MVGHQIDHKISWQTKNISSAHGSIWKLDLSKIEPISNPPSFAMFANRKIYTRPQYRRQVVTICNLYLPAHMLGPVDLQCWPCCVIYDVAV